MASLPQWSSIIHVGDDNFSDIFSTETSACLLSVITFLRACYFISISTEFNCLLSYFVNKICYFSCIRCFSKCTNSLFSSCVYDIQARMFELGDKQWCLGYSSGMWRQMGQWWQLLSRVYSACMVAHDGSSGCCLLYELIVCMSTLSTLLLHYSSSRYSVLVSLTDQLPYNPSSPSLLPNYSLTNAPKYTTYPSWHCSSLLTNLLLLTLVLLLLFPR